MEGTTMHPDHLVMLARLRLAEAEEQHRHRRGLSPRPRPPGRLRHRLANALVRVAARLADEPLVVSPHRAGAR
jgi:hypothetical protein